MRLIGRVNFMTGAKATLFSVGGAAGGADHP